MAKRRKTITAGRLVKTVIYTVPGPRDSEHVRAAKSKATTEAQRALNYKTAQGRLEMLLAANFDKDDFFCTVTYRDECLPKTIDEAKENIRSFFDALRKVRKKRGLVLKYVYVTEGQHGDKRYHHHLVINAVEDGDVETIRSLWPFGDVVDVERIYNYEYLDIAKYITKEAAEGKPVGAPMWSRSRTLENPKVESCFVPDDETIEPPPGAYVLEKEEKQNEFGSFCYLKYRLPTPRKPFKPRPPYQPRGPRAKLIS